MFQHHPFIAAGIGAVNSWFIRDDLLPFWREALKRVASNGASNDASNGQTAVKTVLIFGDGDRSVDYRSPLLQELCGHPSKRISLTTLRGQGHESFDEDPDPVADAIIAFLDRLS